MKAPPFEYVCPASLTEAIDLLGKAKGDAKIIAGGQSLLPILAFRLASPRLLVDIRKLAHLCEIESDGSGVTLGARVTWTNIESSDDLEQSHPLLKAAVAHVAHYQIRNRGTVGGSLAHADPAAELLGVAIACGAKLSISGSCGQRLIKADDFVVDALSTCLEPDDIILSVSFPPWPFARRWAFEEFSRRAGDFALAGIALYFDVDDLGRAHDTRIAVIGACNRPHRLERPKSFWMGRLLMTK